MSPPRDEFVCRACGKPDADSPMLKNELWLKVSPFEEYWQYVEQNRPPAGRPNPRDLLCFDCVEKRLGRRLTCDDLNNSPFSKIIRRMVENERRERRPDQAAIGV